MHRVFQYHNFSETLRGCPRSFSALWDKKFSTTKLWYPLLCINFFNTSIFLKHWRDAHKSFRHCETKNIRRKIVIPHKGEKIFVTLNFLKDWRDAHEIFRHCETKKFRRENVIPHSMHRVFRNPNFSETLRGCPRSFLALWDKKFSTKNCDTP